MSKAFLALSFVCTLSAKDVAIRIDYSDAASCVGINGAGTAARNSVACERFYDKYVDERGYLLHTPRWGTLDGPDDAIETFFNWTLLHALGGSDSVLEHVRARPTRAT